ncbi:hypothetical protein [Adhaeribacter radiodurans]|uniref:Uncharacterized protein n=1 Tax=Adhaeribacter radiodurans TaxID=2745197 RepID=A0A7L7L5Q9_9BACT|nr:hypothetical protein [Adhaeribacter radiodurans]QMU28147.1 hypothetical protein HUW48_08860 [Adhaeribacter radiodurans]
MALQTSTLTVPTYRLAGWAAIGSGLIGIAAFGFLLSAVLKGTATLPHDVSIIIQSLFMLPVVYALHALARRESIDKSRLALYLGLGALSFIVFIMLAGFIKSLGDLLYMVPQGIFGLWLILICRLMAGKLSRALRWLGTASGFGLILIALFLLGYALFVDPIILQGGPPPEGYVIKINTANLILHQILWIGSIMGLPTYPLWSILVGNLLLRERNTLDEICLR